MAEIEKVTAISCVVKFEEVKWLPCYGSLVNIHPSEKQGRSAWKESTKSLLGKSPLGIETSQDCCFKSSVTGHARPIAFKDYELAILLK